MSVTTDVWASGWRADEPPELVPALARYDGSGWGGGHRAAFEYRDLGLAVAHGDFLHARHIRRPGGSETTVGFDWHCHDADFQFNYVVNGTSRVQNRHGDEYALTPGDTIYEPGLYTVREYDFSVDYECIQINVSGGDAGTILGLDPVLPPRAALLRPDRRSIHTSERPDAYEAVADEGGPLRRRDLGTRVASGGRIALRIVRASPAASTVGVEYETRAQWLALLAGTASLALDGRATVELGPFEAICFGLAAPPPITVRSEDFVALELELPRGSP